MSKNVMSKSLNKIRIRPFAAMLVSLILVANIPTASAQQYKKVTRLGTSQSVCPGGVQTEAQMQAFFAENPDAVRAILASSGWAGNADDVFAAVANGDLTERA
ncbi:MAG: hypothetical protein HKN85_04660, partial [Gammaproteobacteria bacterium]|nr:hypothetical protein [Gammaproteobacteria bacterium]